MTGRAGRRQLRWYRTAHYRSANFVIVSVASVLVCAFCFFGLTILTKNGVIGLLLGTAAALPGLNSLASSFRAGIGTGADGVLVRPAYGGSRWIPWSEVQRFDLKEKAEVVGVRGRWTPYQIAVIQKDGTRLATGVWSKEKSAQRARYRTFHDLEADRLKANHRLGLAS